MTMEIGYLPRRDLRLGDLRPGETFQTMDGTPAKIVDQQDMLAARIMVILHPENPLLTERAFYHPSSRVKARSQDQANQWDARYPEKRPIR
jgi:hypothetical protein